MLLGYFLFGIGLLVLLLLAGQALSQANPKTIKWLFIVSTIVIIIVLLRFGAPYLAAIFGALMAAIPWLRKLLGLFLALKSAQQTFGSKSTPPPRTTSNTMTPEEAADILNISINASTAEINKAYKKLMKTTHPDTGGSPYFTRKLNVARETLLKKRENN